ncbi:MAG TPA: ATP phosphoribosyltransferase regulatory subunit, partial [Gemmobacter sp.]|nr:ATP phosphoribosyltransferase regulatory subunit [Gemmobacter sp.]
RALLDRFTGRAALPPARAALLDRLKSNDLKALLEEAGPQIGLRSEAEVAARAQSLLDDAETAPIAAPEAALMYDLIGLAAPADAALHHLRGIEPLMPTISGAVDRFEARLAALRARGIDTAALPFEASHGRSTLEYYDGFVFSFQGVEADAPPVASGGRYDALTAILGQGRSIPAVGGILRPALLAALKGA